MERDIKFRGKSISGDWVYGDLLRRYGMTEIYQPSGTIPIIPETVGQFTGLKDKNGVEIYDGDILKIDEGHPVEVRYEKIYASFGIWRKGWAFLHYFHEAVEPENCEVIGNIHNKNKQQ
jgi:hypothetical protein